MILSNGGEIFQRREKNQRQRGTAKRPTSGNRRQGSETKLTSGDRRHAGDDDRSQDLRNERTTDSGLACRPKGGREAEIDLVPKTRSSKIRTAEGRVLARGFALKLLCCARRGVCRWGCERYRFHPSANARTDGAPDVSWAVSYWIGSVEPPDTKSSMWMGTHEPRAGGLGSASE